jgi:hypothetical protein
LEFELPRSKGYLYSICLRLFRAPVRCPRDQRFASRDGNALANRCVFANRTHFGLSHICGPRCFIELGQNSRFPRFSVVFWFHPRPKEHREPFRRSLTVGSNFETSPAEAGEIDFRLSQARCYELSRSRRQKSKFLLRTRVRVRVAALRLMIKCIPEGRLGGTHLFSLVLGAFRRSCRPRGPWNPRVAAGCTM